MAGKTLVIAPHPDDETLGCGGTLLRRKAEGSTLAWLIVTGMDTQSGWATEQIRQREEEIARVASLTGFDKVFNLGFPAARLETLPLREVVAAFSSVFKSFEPEELLVPHRGDVHSDHRVTFDAVASCAKWFRCSSVRRVLAYETVSETEFGLSSETGFNPNFLVDISRYLNRKLEIMAVYQSELGEFPFPRSIRAIRSLAEWRGASAGYQAAEAFELLCERQ